MPILPLDCLHEPCIRPHASPLTTSVPRPHATFANTLKSLKVHASTTFGAAAVITTPVAFAALYAALRPGLASRGVQAVIGFAAGTFLAYAVTLATGLYARDEDPGPAGLLRMSVSFGLLRFTGTRILFSLLFFAALTVALIPLVAVLVLSGLAGQATPIRTMPAGFIAGVLVTLPLVLAAFVGIYLRFGLAQQASALENLGPLRSLSRSRKITRRRRLDFFLLLLMATAVGFVVDVVLSGPAVLVTGGSAAPISADTSFTWQRFLSMLEGGKPVGPAAAMVVGISAFLSTTVLSTFTAALLAHFFLLLRSEEQPASSPAPLGSHPGPGT